MSVLIIDYGMCNLGSIRRAIEECGADAFVSDNPRHIKNASKVVLPGVGAYADGINNLRQMGWISAIREAVIDDQIPLLGICLGMQLLASLGHEGGKVEGLNLIPGEVKRLEAVSPSERVPHVGWNEVYKTKSDILFNAIQDGSDFYFVHSYHFVPVQSEHILAITPYCKSFVSAISSGTIYGVQFHPEKSGRPGFQLIKNFLRI